MPRAPLPARGVTSYDAASRAPSEGATPPSSLLRAHAPDQDPLTSLGHYPSVGESLQVVVSPCWEMALPDVISASLSLDAWSSIPVGLLVHMPGSSQSTAAFPRGCKRVGFPPQPRPATSRQEGTFEMIDIPVYRSGLQVCLPPRSLPPQQLMPLGSHGVYVRAECMSLPSCTSDMLAV
jgi:hypothetical protein